MRVNNSIHLKTVWLNYNKTLYKSGGKLTKEELLTLIKKRVEEKKAKLESLNKPSNIGTENLLKMKNEISKQQVLV